MLNLRTATEVASKQLTDLIPVRGDPILEEYFLTDGIWHITLSYFSGGNGDAPAAATKELKAFTIDSRSGEILTMKIR